MVSAHFLQLCNKLASSITASQQCGDTAICSPVLLLPACLPTCLFGGPMRDPPQVRLHVIKLPLQLWTLSIPLRHPTPSQDDVGHPVLTAAAGMPATVGRRHAPPPLHESESRRHAYRHNHI